MIETIDEWLGDVAALVAVSENSEPVREKQGNKGPDPIIEKDMIHKKKDCRVSFHMVLNTHLNSQGPLVE